MLLELMVGDAYGAAFEFASKDFVNANNDLVEYANRGDPDRIGRYTDDTQMSLAIAELLVAGEDLTPRNFAEWWVMAYKRDPRQGYARGFRAFLEDVTDGADFLKRIKPHSRRCGAAMRAPPLGVLQDPKEVVEISEMQASLTHDTLVGRRSAAVAALMSHYFIYRLGLRQSVGKFVSKYVKGSWEPDHSGPVSMQGCQVVRAAMTAIYLGRSMAEILKTCISFTGDTDSVAAIALAAAAHCKGLPQDLPTRLIMDLEDGPYGRTYIEGVDDQLMSMT